MDEVKIKTNFAKELLSKIIEKALEKNGIESDVNLNDILITHEDGDVINVSLSANMSLSQQGVYKLVLSKIKP